MIDLRAIDLYVSIKSVLSFINIDIFDKESEPVL